MTIDPRSVTSAAWRVAAVVVATAVLVWVVLGLRDVIFQAFIALIVAAALLAPVTSLERRMPRGAAIAVAVLGVVAVIVLILVLVIPPLVSQFAAFLSDLPDLVDNLLANLEHFFDSLLGPGRGSEIVGSWTDGSPDVPNVEAIIGIGASLFEAAFFLITLLIITVLMLAERDRARTWVGNFWNEDERPWAVGLLSAAIGKLGAYVRGLLLVMTFQGIAMTIGATVLGLPFAVVLGALTFLAAAIPYLGTLLMIVPAFIVGISVSPAAAVLIVVWIIILEQLEGLVLTPVIQSKAVEISPLAVMLGVLGGFALFGIVGGVIAVPLVAMADLVIREIVFPMRQGRLEESKAEAAAAAALATALAPAPSPTPEEAPG